MPTQPTEDSSPPGPSRPPGPIDLNRYPLEMAWQGIQTFMKLPVCLTPEDLRVGKIDAAVAGVPWDQTAMTRSGTHLGPKAIRACDHLPSPPWSRPHLHVRVDPFEHLNVCDYSDAEIIIGNTERTFANVRGFVSEILSGGALPIILGGDHGITWPVATAIADHYGYGRIGIVHFDAHADTAPDMQGELAGHGTPMRRLIESGAVLGKNFVQVGLRGYWPGPDVVAWMEEQEMRSHFMAEVQRHGFDVVLERAVNEALSGSADLLYISVDVDAVDPSHAPGTGSPEPGGLASADVLRAVRRLAAEVGMVGMDIVEVSPPYDSGNNITALFAHRCVLEGLTGTAMRRLGMTEPDYLDPRAADGPPPLRASTTNG
ncbi:MAG TPA: agmatinase family protein [Acidimicrobiales bacterium]|jgi:agmatinase|nr:agmatinase family protein [Acidimicrobiales bacterium]